jgi:transposase-like protein
MPKVSATTTAKVDDFGVAIDRSDELDGYAFSFVTINEDHSLAPMLSGLPEGRCWCPHWGYRLCCVGRSGWCPETGRVRTSKLGSSAPIGYRFPREVIAVAVRWYLRYGLSYRDVEELLAERGITVDHVTIYRWVQTFTAEFIEAARPARHTTGDRCFLDETYVKVAGRWTYLYRAIDQYGQVIDVLVSQRRDAHAARTFFARALTHGPSPVEVTTDRAPVYPRVIDELAIAARHVLEQYANNKVEADHGRLKARLRPMRGLKKLRSLRTVAAGHAFVQNLRRGHYEITVDARVHDRVQAAFTDLAVCL